MGAKLVLLIVVAFSGHCAWALQCYRCASFMLPGTSLSNQGEARCGDDPPPDEFKADCTGATSGCITIAGAFQATRDGADLNVNNATLRTCANVGIVDCKYGLEANFDVVFLLRLGNSSVFDGKICSCRGDSCNGGDIDNGGGDSGNGGGDNGNDGGNNDGGGGSALRPLSAILALAVAAKRVMM
ncbi:uncharacterized protein LOC119735415 [Patiria miniata]|uniref:Protein sleepless n=1 Tax=Patiria miniata TaxID=46514 RepID=A0A914AN59_PATMI|nr:uncharacterized protein LOC119735415 [Patiria miniata]XP_038065042.1 uncharacterized protein LOC119735415 [Patiria miniata]XP_038065043.1 uncharacterized protein LOC119735415 [Patiria miniata]